MTASMNEIKNQKSRKNYLETVQEVDVPTFLIDQIISIQLSIDMYSLKSMHRYFLKNVINQIHIFDQLNSWICIFVL